MNYNRFCNLASTVTKLFFIFLALIFLGCSANSQSEESKAVDGPEDGETEIILRVSNDFGTPNGQKIHVSYQIDNYAVTSSDVFTEGSPPPVVGGTIWEKRVRIHEKITLSAKLPSSYNGGKPISVMAGNTNTGESDSQNSSTPDATITAKYPKPTKTSETISILP